MLQKSTACSASRASQLSTGTQADRSIALALDAIEAEHDFVLVVAQIAPGPWTRRCIGHSDEILLIAEAAQPPAVHSIEQTCLTERPARSEAAEILLLLHPADLVTPRGTREWLARRPVTGARSPPSGTGARHRAPGSVARAQSGRSRFRGRRCARFCAPWRLACSAAAGRRNRLRRRHQHRCGVGGAGGR